ncbi:universal stress protein [Ligilactobacillus acidipiscis DSM 15836]|uniref:Universal stress protein n=1 Tax=Ligilactobacillus acidipiscis DSM 15836 TaxID=1423716 RepID=A0ABR5PH71_9LACO|nr:universal stress protein [Ligilactobacillus acidipiscis]KRM20033.1 universal stress protein [Ligilactobacillus acidipiscis DSM 15836]GAW63783.1 universal stress protein UspA [Ligilactobacillus acidipiscis]GEN19724.1 universal stress protein [Ligilactobacillus acidipiscis]
MTLNYQRILVAVNKSAGADRALEKAVATAKRNHARLDILRVIDINSLQYEAGGQTVIDGQDIYDIEQSNEEFLTELREKILRNDGLDPEQVFVHLRFGNPRTVILDDFQPEYHNDLLVIGGTEMSLFKRMLAGSVTSYVPRAAQCDVLITKK